MRQLKISQSITTRDNISLDKYLSEIGKHSMVTAEEEVVLAQKIRNGDLQALQKLTNANLRFVVSVAKQYQNNGLSLNDLINEGNVGLIKAARRFDETRGFKFISYAVWWIRQSIIQAISEQSRLIRLPLNKIGLLNKIKKATTVLNQQLEREATVEEIATVIEVSEEEIKVALNASNRVTSTDAPISSNDDGILSDLIAHPDNIQPDNGLMLSSLNMDIKRVLSTLTEREREVIILFYGIGSNHGLTLEEIGKKYELTRERVRQIKEKGIRKLKHSVRSRLLKVYLP